MKIDKSLEDRIFTQYDNGLLVNRLSRIVSLLNLEQESTDRTYIDFGGAWRWNHGRRIYIPCYRRFGINLQSGNIVIEVEEKDTRIFLLFGDGLRNENEEYVSKKRIKFPLFVDEKEARYKHV